MLSFFIFIHVVISDTTSYWLACRPNYRHKDASTHRRCIGHMSVGHRLSVPSTVCRLSGIVRGVSCISRETPPGCGLNRAGWMLHRSRCRQTSCSCVAGWLAWSESVRRCLCVVRSTSCVFLRCLVPPPRTQLQRRPERGGAGPRRIGRSGAELGRARMAGQGAAALRRQSALTPASLWRRRPTHTERHAGEHPRRT